MVRLPVKPVRPQILRTGSTGCAVRVPGGGPLPPPSLPSLETPPLPPCSPRPGALRSSALQHRARLVSVAKPEDF